MRDIKVVAYGAVSEDDERLIGNYLAEKMDRVRIFSVDTALDVANKEITRLEAEVERLTPEEPEDG